MGGNGFNCSLFPSHVDGEGNSADQRGVKALTSRSATLSSFSPLPEERMKPSPKPSIHDTVL